MKLPWVSRREHERVSDVLREARREQYGLEWNLGQAQKRIEALETETRSWRAMLEVERQRYIDLTQQMLMMQREGFSVPRPVAVLDPAKQESDLPAEIEKVLGDLGLDGRLLEQQRELARRLMTQRGADPKEVAAAIYRGNTVVLPEEAGV